MVCGILHDHCCFRCHGERRTERAAGLGGLHGNPERQEHCETVRGTGTPSPTVWLATASPLPCSATRTMAAWVNTPVGPYKIQAYHKAAPKIGRHTVLLVCTSHWATHCLGSEWPYTYMLGWAESSETKPGRHRHPQTAESGAVETLLLADHTERGLERTGQRFPRCHT